jgi:hypothetical protein
MAYHYEPQVDVSDDEDGPIDINAWKSGSASQQQRAPVVPVVAGPSNDASDDGVAARASSALDSFRSGSKRKRSTPPPPPPPPRQSSGFTSINRPVASAPESPIELPDFDANVVDSEPEEEAVEETQTPARPQPRQRSLAPVLPRAALADEEEIVDMTAGDDVVRRVVKELETDDGTMVYEVEFEDFHVEEACFCFVFPVRI